MTKREAFAMFVSLLLSLLVTLVFWVLGNKPPITLDALYNAMSVSTGIILTVASASLALGVTAANVLVKISATADEMAGRARQHGDQIDKRLTQIEESIGSLQASTQSLQNSVIEEVRAGIGKMKRPVRKATAKIIEDFEQTVSLSNTGVRIDGCEWALRAYQTVWEHLVEEQRRLQSEGKDPIIARITHSNEISVWIRDSDSVIQSLYVLQQTFVDYGGIIYRILIKERGANREPYEEVKKQMESAGVQVYIIDQANYAAAFDFLLVRDDTGELGGDVVVKWITGATGGKLAAAEVEDSITDVVRRDWRLVCNIVEEQNGGKKSFSHIPESRRII